MSVSLNELENFSHPLLRVTPVLAPPARQFLTALQALVTEDVIKMQTVQTLEYRGRMLVMTVFQALASNPERLLSDSDRRTLRDRVPILTD